jgi:hypothetical protein
LWGGSFETEEGCSRFFLIPSFFDRRVKAVKAFNRRLFSALVTMGMLGVTGCGADNEAEGEKLAKKEPDPGKPAAGSTPEKPAFQPKTNAERPLQGPTGTAVSKGYPGKK